MEATKIVPISPEVVNVGDTLQMYDKGWTNERVVVVKQITENFVVVKNKGKEKFEFLHRKISKRNNGKILILLQGLESGE